MRASELIKRLSARIEVFGDQEVAIRVLGEDENYPIGSVFGDVDSGKIIVSDMADFIGEE